MHISANHLIAIFVTFAHAIGIVQFIVLLIDVIALITMKLQVWKAGNMLMIFLATICVLKTGLIFTLIELCKVKAILHVAINTITSIICSITAFVMFANPFVNFYISLGCLRFTH